MRGSRGKEWSSPWCPSELDKQSNKLHGMCSV